MNFNYSLYSYSVACVNRLLPVGIVLFRYVYVCKVRSQHVPSHISYHGLFIFVQSKDNFLLYEG